MRSPALESASPASEQNSFLLHLALSAISIAQPFYSVTGKTLNFFVAWRMSGVEFMLCILLIYLVPPVITWLLVSTGYRLHRHLGRILLSLVFWLYISLACLAATQQLTRSIRVSHGYEVTFGIVALSLTVAALLAAALLAKPKAQGFVKFFAVITIVFPAIVLLRAHEVGVIQFSEAPPAEKITTADRPNVILIIYDELPLTTILDADGLIDKRKFPNFYEFAQGATWLPNARSLSGHTETAVPPILAGRVREDGVPATYKSYPENIFHRLAPSYNVLDLQFATDMNPVKQPGAAADPRDEDHRLGKIARDVAIIFAHVAAPPQLAAGFPPVNTQHNRFGEDILNSSRGVRHHEKFVTALAQVKQPFLAVYHNVYPHNVWNHYPSGRPYPVSRWGDYISLDREETKLGNDSARILHDYEAHLLQSMHADKLFGELLTQLKSNGQYDHSIIAFVADHGVALWPEERPRSPGEARRSDVFAIPLIVKLPGQTRAGISLDPAYTMDLYPTILEYLGVAIPERLQGKSLIKSIRDAVAADTVKSTSYRDDPTLKRRVEWFGTGTSMADLYGLGKFRGYIGRSVNEFETASVPEALVHLYGTGFSRAGPQLSARIDGQISGGPRDGEARDILVALGDRFCGAAQTTDLEVGGQANSFTLIVAEGCLDLLKNGIRIFVAGPDGRLAEMPVYSQQSATPPAVVAQTLQNLTELIGSLQKTGGDVQGQVNLKALRERGVAMPSLLVRERQLATSWGDVVLMRDGRRWVIDLYSAPKDVCKAVHLRADKIPGVVRIAASAAARDEVSIPVTAEQAEFACSNTDSDIIRIIAADSTPASSAPATGQVIDMLAQFIGRLEKIGDRDRRQVSLQVLSKAGVTVPEMFVRDGQLAWPWGPATLTRDGSGWTVDLYSAPRDVCEAVQLAAIEFPGAARIATTALAKDEASIPVTSEHAKVTCSKAESGLIRIITADAPAGGAPSVPLAAIDPLLAQLAEFIGGLGKTSGNAQGQVTLQALRKLGVAVPASFVRDQQLAWRWGEVTLTRGERRWVLDLHSAPEAVCRALHLAANGIQGIARIATSSLAKDEVTIPVTAEHADAACANRKTDVIRIIATDRPSTARLALDKLAAAWRRLERAVSGK